MTDEQIIKLAEEHLVPVYEGVSGRLYHSNPPCDDATDSVLKFARAILAAEGSAAPAEPAPDQDGIFTVKNGEWRARVRGVLQAAVWDSYESAWAAYAKARYAQPVADSPAPEPLPDDEVEPFPEPEAFAAWWRLANRPYHWTQTRLVALHAWHAALSAHPTESDSESRERIRSAYRACLDAQVALYVALDALDEWEWEWDAARERKDAP